MNGKSVLMASLVFAGGILGGVLAISAINMAQAQDARKGDAIDLDKAIDEVRRDAPEPAEWTEEAIEKHIGQHEEALESLRRKLKEEKGPDARRMIEEKLKAMEQSLEKLRGFKRKLEPMKPMNPEDALGEINREVERLLKRLKSSEDKFEKEQIEDTVRELRRAADAIRGNVLDERGPVGRLLREADVYRLPGHAFGALPGQAGTYQLHQSGNDTLLLDTRTGAMWGLTKSGDVWSWKRIPGPQDLPHEQARREREERETETRQRRLDEIREELERLREQQKKLSEELETLPGEKK